MVTTTFVSHSSGTVATTLHIRIHCSIHIGETRLQPPLFRIHLAELQPLSIRTVSTTLAKHGYNHLRFAFIWHGCNRSPLEYQPHWRNMVTTTFVSHSSGTVATTLYIRIHGSIHIGETRLQPPSFRIHLARLQPLSIRTISTTLAKHGYNYLCFAFIWHSCNHSPYKNSR